MIQYDSKPRQIAALYPGLRMSREMVANIVRKVPA